MLNGNFPSVLEEFIISIPPSSQKNGKKIEITNKTEQNKNKSLQNVIWHRTQQTERAKFTVYEKINKQINK